MKTINLIIVSLFILSAQAGYADSKDQSNGCCPTNTNNTAVQNQQLQLDAIQNESENIIMHSTGLVHWILQDKVMEKTSESIAMKNIQFETENYPIATLEQLAQKVDLKVAGKSSQVSK
jgi:predicted class III extradiol MEMO1 family dioxygenase